MKELGSPAANGLAWPRFFRRMTSGIVLCLEGGKDVSRSSDPSLNLYLFTLVLGSPAGLVTLPSLCWSCRALPAWCWLEEKSASSKNSKLLRAHHDEESWNNVGGAGLWDSVCMMCATTWNTALRERCWMQRKHLARLFDFLRKSFRIHSCLVHCLVGLPCCLKAGPPCALQGPPGILAFACNPKQKENLC